MNNNQKSKALIISILLLTFLIPLSTAQDNIKVVKYGPSIKKLSNDELVMGDLIKIGPRAGVKYIYFGMKVAISGSYCVIGSSIHDPENNKRTKYIVELYYRNSNTWKYSDTILLPPYCTINNIFIDDDYMTVSTRDNIVSLHSNIVLLYKLSNNSFVFIENYYTWNDGESPFYENGHVVVSEHSYTHDTIYDLNNNNTIKLKQSYSPRCFALNNKNIFILNSISFSADLAINIYSIGVDTTQHYQTITSPYGDSNLTMRKFGSIAKANDKYLAVSYIVKSEDTYTILIYSKDGKLWSLKYNLDIGPYSNFFLNGNRLFVTNSSLPSRRNADFDTVNIYELEKGSAELINSQIYERVDGHRSTLEGASYTGMVFQDYNAEKYPAREHVLIQNLSGYGSLKVNITPQEAIDKGAAWKLFQQVSYRPSGNKADGIIAGKHNVVFNKADGFEPVIQKSVDILNHRTTVLNVHYYRPGEQPEQKPDGKIKVIIRPAAVRNLPGTYWQIAGEDQQYKHGDVVKLAPGEYRILCYTGSGWTKPVGQRITVEPAKRTRVVFKAEKK